MSHRTRSFHVCSNFGSPALVVSLSPFASDLCIMPSLLYACEVQSSARFLHETPMIIHSISVTFPFLEAIVVAGIRYGDTGGHSVMFSCLESLTLPLPWCPNHLWFTGMLYGLHLPVLRKLTLEGDPTKSAVDCIMAGLAVTATCNLQVIDFQTLIPQDEVDVDVVEPLLSVVREISVCSVLLRCRD
ncbi:hypothetical protein BDR07DRAFT_696285 [Suillus spraguei]|nr:hypothetical protein BDR07DRAFT_696285 [Suillus spraguei]